MANNFITNNSQSEYEEIAQEIMQLAHDGLLMNLRFLDVAVEKLSPSLKSGMGAFVFDGSTLYIDPVLLIRKYKRSVNYAARLYLHTLLHLIFAHAYKADKMDKRLWNPAIDLAVESVIIKMNLGFLKMETDAELSSRLSVLSKQANGLTADKLYKYFLVEEPSNKAMEDYERLCKYDEHTFYERQYELVADFEAWKKISERVGADIKSFSRGKSGSDDLMLNLNEATKTKVDYGDFLRRFMVIGETVHINDDEFDYIYYTYGLHKFGNIPLVEPLEYRDECRIRDFVIAIDTSASCKGSIVREFLLRTYEIMSSSENFFNKINVHILMCDSEIRRDAKITCKEEFESFMTNVRVSGFGSTDFRPVFEYVDEMILRGEFADLRGLIYFTDGYGVYPEKMTDYDTAFVFIADDDNAPPVPPWAMKIVLDKIDFE